MVLKTSHNKTTLLSKCLICATKKSRFIKEQEARGSLSNLGAKIHLRQNPLLGNILFQMIQCLL